MTKIFLLNVPQSLNPWLAATNKKVIAQKAQFQLHQFPSHCNFISKVSTDTDMYFIRHFMML